ncbi:Lrp/AsnC ligand binding domain-containing protein [Paenibacillus sp. LHD-38]|uniref:Lrp/AsnC ligand binding domain-containing protein n=1 Tax=Paenibacillus sp. LHD-38 TaxID=3072143 RepID=UPI0028102551|nr:Lrp/AsnC ligand binding domain-containing protein [Paenibacillus sp. LHD-38]MDQ8736358.1 Lrp/AsnC ligand binding domain-containing protein [Paenibacillus sp. LHD-38]
MAFLAAVAYCSITSRISSCDIENFVDHCKNSPDVLELHRISGQYNFLVKVASESLQSMETVINELGKHGDSTTLIVLSSPIEHNKVIPDNQHK